MKERDSRSPLPQLDTQYTADDNNWLGKIWTINGVEYMFCLFSAGITEYVQKYDALTVSPAGVAAFPTSNKINGIAGSQVNAKLVDKYALVAVWSPIGSTDSLTNVSHIATASASWANQFLTYSADAAGYGNKGRPVTGAAWAATTAATGGLSAYSSANTQQIEDNIYTNLAAITAGLLTKLKVAGNVSCYTGANTSDIYFTYGTAGTLVSAMTTPVKDYVKIGSVITIGGESQVVTAVSTATDGATALLATAHTVGYTGSASACTKVYIGNMRVQSILE